MKYTLALKNLPFEPLKKQIIYIESSYDEAVNKYIQDNLEHFCVYCHLRGYEFCYFPKMFERAIDEDVLFYNVPYANPSETSPEPIGSDFLLRYMSHPENKELIPPSLIYLSDSINEKPEKGETLFKAVSVTDQDEYPTIADIFDLRLKEIIKELFEGIEHSEIKFSLAPKEEKKEKSPIKRIWESCENTLGEDDEPYPQKSADDRFEEESTQLSPEVKEEIKKMVVKQGVDALQLIQYIKSLEPLSRLHITKDFHIFVPDYGNKEIEMFPLHKAVFLLFLRHQEGIRFKCLPDYKEELMQIYSQLKPTEGKDKILESIEKVTNPLNNTINEYCARIREAFIRVFNEHLAQNYFITGTRGEAKKITLPRDLVVWD